MPPDGRYDALLRAATLYGYVVREYDHYGEARVGMWADVTRM